MSIEAYPSPNGVLTSLIWRKTMSGGETSLSGYDNASQALSYTPGQEQVYLNGILLVRGDDYTATNGTSVTGLSALAASDFVQINCYNNFSVASVPSQNITGTIANNQLQNSAITINGSAISLGGSVTLAGDIESVTATSPLTGGGSTGALTVGIQEASTSQRGSVQLSDSTSTTSSVLAATPTAVKSAYDLADGAIPKTLTTTKGDIIVATGNATLVRQGVGSDGQVLTADSTQADGVIWSTPSSGAPVVAGKNAVINGAFDVWQRGTSSTASTNTAVYSGADRWQHYSGGTTNYTLSRQSSGLTGFQYCARVARNAASTATNLNWFTHTIESADCYKFAGQTVTLSFYARAGANFSAASNYISVLMDSGTGTDQNILNGFTGSTVILSSGATLTTSWQRFTFTMSVASTATQLGLYIRNTPVGTAGAADHYEITGVQLEVGSVATQFSRAGGTIAGELAACQRYCVKFTPATNNGYERIGISLGTNSSGQSIFLNLPVEMRTYPTSMTTSGSFAVWNANTTTVSSLALSTTPGTHKSAVFLSSTGNSNGFNYFHFNAANPSTDYMLFSAEL